MAGATPSSDATSPTPYFSHQRDDVEPFVPASARRILDVGCAAGRFGQLVRSRRPGSTVHGIEPNAEAAASATQLLDAVHCGPFGAAALLALGSATYDCVVFNDVLEHLVDPAAALVAARQVLAPGGTLVASVPNVRNFRTLDEILRGGRFRYRESGVLDATHLRFFCRADLVELFQGCGFAVQTVTGTNALWLSNWRRWRLASWCIGNDLRHDGRYQQFIVVATPAGASPAPRS